MDGFCRACLSKDDEQTDLLQYSEKNRRLFVYSTGLQVKRNDAFTFQLCQECYINMNFACNFKKTCRNSDKKIKNYSAIKDIGENVDVCSFFKQNDDSLKLRLPSNTGSSTPHNLKDDDNESTCTSIQNFMTDILQEIPDSEAHIIRQVIEEEADILEDSLDSHWLQDDVSVDSEFKMDFSFSPFSTSRSIQNVRDENLSPIKSNSNERTNKTETPKSILNNVVPNEIENFGNIKTTENHKNIVPNAIENFGNILTTENHNNIVPNEIENFGNILTTENHINIVPNETENFGNIKTTENHNNIVPNEIENFVNIKTTENHNNIVPNEIENFVNIKTTENHNNIVPNEIENFVNIKTTENHNNVVPNEIENFVNIKTTENHNNIVPNEIENFVNIKTTENHNNIVPNEIEKFVNIKTTENRNNIVPNEIENFDSLDKIINNKSREIECAIDINLENALKNDTAQKIMLDELLTSPLVLPNITSPSTPLIKKILFGELKDESSQSKETVKEFDEIKENMEVLEEFLNTNVLNEDDSIYNDIDKIEKYLPKSEIKSKVLENMSPAKNKYCITNFYCKMCDRKFKNLVALKIHCTRYHKLRIPKQRIALNKFICDYCGKCFNSSRCIIKHIENHKNPVKFECKRCSLKFNTKTALRQHQTTHNHKAMVDNVTKNHVCSICGWACTSNSNYNIHIKRHFKIYMHSCKECGQGFYRKCDLDAHTRKHTGERPYQCDFCSKSFARHDALTRHIKRHTDERPFPCNFCKAAFTNAYDLKHHKENAKSCLKIQIELAT